MTREEEENWWRQIISELNEKFTLSYLANQFHVSERQVSNWKSGDRPLGFKAIEVYLFHAKHRSPVQISGIIVQVSGTTVPSQTPAK